MTSHKIMGANKYTVICPKFGTNHYTKSVSKFVTFPEANRKTQSWCTLETYVIEKECIQSPLCNHKVKLQQYCENDCTFPVGVIKIFTSLTIGTLCNHKYTYYKISNVKTWQKLIVRQSSDVEATWWNLIITNSIKSAITLLNQLPVLLCLHMQMSLLLPFPAWSCWMLFLLIRLSLYSVCYWSIKCI